MLIIPMKLESSLKRDFCRNKMHKIRLHKNTGFVFIYVNSSGSLWNGYTIIFIFNLFLIEKLQKHYTHFEKFPTES